MKNIIKIFSAFLLLVTAFSGCDDDSSTYPYDNDGSSGHIRGSGNIVSQTREVGECNGISLRYAGNIFLTQDNTQTIRVEADDNIIDHVVTRKNNGYLEAGLQGDDYSDVTVRIYVSLKTIESISIDGAGNITTQNSLNCENLNCSILGAGNISLKGNGNYLICSINGAGNIDAERFISKKCLATVNGTGNSTVNVTEELNASVNGVGSIIYSGNPESVSTSVTGLGSIREK